MKFVIPVLVSISMALCAVEEDNFIQRTKRDSFPTYCEEKIVRCCQSGDYCDFDCSAAILDSSQRYDDVSILTNDILTRSLEYLFMGSEFDGYFKNYPGFEKLIAELGDKALHQSIQLMKELAKRGAAHSFKKTTKGPVKVGGQISELEALAMALDIEKEILTKANDVHRYHSHASLGESKAKSYDVGMATFIDDNIIKNRIETVRKLTGYVTELKNLFRKDSSMYTTSLYLFDQYIQSKN